MKKQIAMALIVGAAVFVGGIASAYADSDIDYYKQFLYQKETDDDGDGEVHTQWRWLMGSGEIEITPNDILIAQIDAILIEDMSSVLRYREMFKWRKDANSPWEYKQPQFPDGFCPVEIKGRWSVPDQRLELGDAAFGARETWHSQNAVRVEFPKALRHPALAGKSVVLSYGYSNVDKDAGKMPFCP